MLFLYFTCSKSHFSILTTHYYKTTLISFSILQYIILKYYKIILYLFIFFFSHSNQTNDIHQNPGSRSTTTSTTRSIAQINNPAQPRSTTHSRLQLWQPPITPTPTLANPNPPQPISIKINKITNQTQPQPCYPTITKESIGEAESVRRFFYCGFARSPQLWFTHAGPVLRRSPSSRPQGYRDLLVHEKLDHPKKQEIQRERRAEQRESLGVERKGKKRRK